MPGLFTAEQVAQIAQIVATTRQQSQPPPPPREVMEGPGEVDRESTETGRQAI